MKMSNSFLHSSVLTTTSLLHLWQQ